jgi:hypothetical protein
MKVRFTLKRLNIIIDEKYFKDRLYNHILQFSDQWFELQMKGRWEAWFQFMYSQKWNCSAALFPKQNYNALPPNFHIHVFMTDLYIPRIGLSILLQPNRQTDPGNT